MSLLAEGGLLFPSPQALSCASISLSACWNLPLFLFAKQQWYGIHSRSWQAARIYTYSSHASNGEKYTYHRMSGWKPGSVHWNSKMFMVITWKLGFSEIVLCMSLLKDKRHIVPEWLVMLLAFLVEKDMEARQHREKDFCDPLVMPVTGRGWNLWYVCYLLLDGTYLGRTSSF